VLAEPERVAQGARRPPAVAGGVEGGAEVAVEPARVAAVARLEPDRLADRPRVVELRGELRGRRVGVVPLAVEQRGPVEAAAREQRAVGVVGAVRPQLGGELVTPRRERALPRGRRVDQHAARGGDARAEEPVERRARGAEVGPGDPRVLAAGAHVHHHGLGQHVARPDLPVGVRRDVDAAVGRGPAHVLQRRAGERPGDVVPLAVDRADEPAVVGQVADARGERQPAAPVAHVPGAVPPVAVHRRQRVAAAHAEVGLLLQHDVDDAGHPLGVVLGRRVRHHLDALDHGAGDLLQERGELRPAQRRGPAVDLHHHVVVAAQAHLAVGVHLDRGHDLEHLARARRARRDVLRAVVAPVGRDGRGVRLADDAHLGERQGDPRNADGVEVDARVGRVTVNGRVRGV
jgi:hypothetical protein